MNSEEEADLLDDQTVTSPTHPIVTIKHGKDPEVQEVSIAPRLNEEGEFLERPEECRKPEEEIKLSRKLKKTKSMTTKSTMTNEDDYTVVHTNTPCTSPATSILEGNAEDNETNDAIEVGHKIVGWKITPRVHFPPPNTINASSLRTSEPMRPLPQDDSKDFFVSIEPPYMHRPDRTLIVRQTKPLPLQPVKAWPGYGGNVYFQAFKVDAKPIGDRSFSNKTPVSRSVSVSGSRHEKPHMENDAFSVSKFSSFYRSSPSLGSTRKSPSRNLAAREDVDFDQLHVQEYTKKPAQRKMARLDKNYICGLHSNGQMTEDLAWISGMDSLGTLKIGNPLVDVKRQSTYETFTRHTVVEKIPRNFVFHPVSKSEAHEIAGQNKINEKVKSSTIRKYLKSYGIPDWALKQFVEKFYRDDRGRLRLPAIPLRVKGQKAHVFGNSEEFSCKTTMASSQKVELNTKNKKVVLNRIQASIPVQSTNDKSINDVPRKKTNSFSHKLPSSLIASSRAKRPERFSGLNELLIDHYSGENS